MGKRYLCDYCHKSLVAAPSVVRTHQRGLLHQQLVHEHYQQYKDPDVILAEEAFKKPCLRFANGSCSFGGLCRYSHYSNEELDNLKRAVAVTKANSGSVPQPPPEGLCQELQRLRPPGLAVSYNADGETSLFPWKYNVAFDKYALPPSLKRMDDDDFSFPCNPEWGLG